MTSHRTATWTAALTAHPALAAALARLLARGRHLAATWTLPSDLPPGDLDALDALLGLPFRRERTVRLAAWRDAIGPTGLAEALAAVTAVTGTAPADPPRERLAAAELARTGCASLDLPPALAALLAAELADPRLGERVRRLGGATWLAERRLAYRTAAALADPEAPQLDVSTWGARLAGDSKALRPGRPLRQAVLALFRRLVPELAEAPLAAVAAQAGLDADGASAVALCCGPLRLRLGDRELAFPAELATCGQAAALSAGLLAEAVLVGAPDCVLTCENPAPFASLCALGAELPEPRGRILIVLTNGFPNRAVRTLLDQLRPLVRRHLHWGDTDLAGIRIARICAAHLGSQPGFWRCTAPTRLTLDDAARDGLRRDLARFPEAPGAGLLRETLAADGWCEQEAWTPATG